MTTPLAPADPAPTINRNDRRRQRTRETILAAADRVFRRKGVDAATVNDVTEEADVAYGTFYNHFKTMDDVVAALAAETLLRVADRTHAIIQKAERVELLPCVGARVVLRMLSQDPAILAGCGIGHTSLSTRSTRWRGHSCSAPKARP